MLTELAYCYMTIVIWSQETQKSEVLKQTFPAVMHGKCSSEAPFKQQSQHAMKHAWVKLAQPQEFTPCSYVAM